MYSDVPDIIVLYALNTHLFTVDTVFNRLVKKSLDRNAEEKQTLGEEFIVTLSRYYGHVETDF